MKRKLFIVAMFVCSMFGLSSCIETIHGNYGIVTNVASVSESEANKYSNYKYVVKVKQGNNLNNSGYYILTNELYQVGDTLYTTSTNQHIKNQ